VNVLITGGAGFKGVVLTEMLARLSAGHEIVVIDNFRWGLSPVLTLFQYPNVKIVKGDVRDKQLMEGYVLGADVIINLAGIVGYPECARFEREAREVNVDAVYQLADMVKPSQKFIQASTGSVYGKLDDTCTETSGTNPLTVYGETNLEAETPVLGAGGICLRFATAFGISPCMRFDLLPNFFSFRAVHDRYLVVYEAEARRTFIDTYDMARAYLFAIDHYEAMKGGIFNVGDERLNVNKGDVAEWVCELTGADLFIESVGKDLDARDYEVSYAKINALGYFCQHTVQDRLPLIVKIAELYDRRDNWRIG